MYSAIYPYTSSPANKMERFILSRLLRPTYIRSLILEMGWTFSNVASNETPFKWRFADGPIVAGF